MVSDPLGVCVHVVYSGVFKAVDGMHFVRDLINIVTKLTWIIIPL